MEIRVAEKPPARRSSRILLLNEGTQIHWSRPVLIFSLGRKLANGPATKRVETPVVLLKP